MSNTELLLDALEYYTVDPVGRRCVDEDNECRYSPVSLGRQETSEGCAIGRLLNSDVAKRIDDRYGSVGIDTLIKKQEKELPDFMNVTNFKFLSKCQNLHDINYYWTKTGLSDIGKNRVSAIIEEYNLDKDKFEKFLN
jgi:hypothetical protein